KSDVGCRESERADSFRAFLPPPTPHSPLPSTQSLMTRLACFYVPMFALAARLRSEPDLLNEAVGIVEGSGNNAHIVAATRRARKKGVQPGQSLAQARTLVPKLIARGRDAECERTAQEALLEVAETFSPRVEDAGEGVVFLDVTGMERHFADFGD